MKNQISLPDERNRDIIIYVGGELLHRDEAKISVFDSLVQGGDGVWEGLRVYQNKIFSLDQHLQRMFDSAKAMQFAHVPTADEIKDALYQTLKANNMRDGVHIRLTLSRGTKVTSGMSPSWNQYGSTLIIIAEWKAPVFNQDGLRLITSAVRRNTPQCLDSKIHHNNLINNILAKIQAEQAGVDEAVMLDVDGFVAETNACNIFFVKDGRLLTPFADACLPGITRKKVLALAPNINIEAQEARISMAQMYGADEVFITGTMGELTPITEIDGRKFEIGPITKKLQLAFKGLTDVEGWQIPAF
jgi:branched-chain amino acid aminotransferase group I